MTKKPRHLDGNKQPEDSSRNLKQKSIAVSQDDLNEKSSQESNTSLERNEEEKTQKKRKKVAANNPIAQRGGQLVASPVLLDGDEVIPLCNQRRGRNTC